MRVVGDIQHQYLRRWVFTVLMKGSRLAWRIWNCRTLQGPHGPAGTSGKPFRRTNQEIILVVMLRSFSGVLLVLAVQYERAEQSDLISSWLPAALSDGWG